MRHPIRQSALAAFATLVVLGVNTVASGQDTNGTQSGEFVTREEYEKLLKEVEDLKATIRNLKEGSAPEQPASSAAIEDLSKRLDEVQSEANRTRPGFNKLVIAGDAEATFESREGSKSTFGAGVAPLFLWGLSDRLLFEGGLDIGISNNDSGEGQTDVDLTLANLSYLANDYLTVGAGLFVLPFGVYHAHYDPLWIDAFPDSPLPFADGGIAPESDVGIYAQGAAPLGNVVLNYHLYVTNGPRLITDDPDAAGSLSFDNYDDINNGKTVGGRLALRPVRGLEFGYSWQYGKVGSVNGDGVNAYLQAFDAEYRRDFDRLYGQIDLRSEIVLSHVDRATYGVGDFGPVSFSNNRNGGYIQAAYRPWMVKQRILKNFEFAARYDWQHSPLDAPGGDHERRWTLGLDYWLRPNVVLKGAYQFDHKTVGEDSNAVLFQVGIGL